ncbi:hypothetical protein P343_02350 [Sporolactobacillus laevolacticus DSM 442]|uniref:Uncharacterized protein n=1 Tax=Sporolactobacillus laevolacticus DSM 442 TaxID=1395513 RepID=V6JAC1_9BACL|nr:hypothetical protein P343_02350 [Sporolactobacillus laevolacticus DSM 442]
MKKKDSVWIILFIFGRAVIKYVEENGQDIPVSLGLAAPSFRIKEFQAGRKMI